MSTMRFSLIQKQNTLTSTIFNKYAGQRFNRSDILSGIALLLIATVLLQLFKLIFVPAYVDKSAHIFNALFHCILFGLSLRYCIGNCFIQARVILILSFITYITFACLLWQTNLNIQYFYLLAVFVVAYLYGKNQRGETEHHQKWFFSILAIILFLYFQTVLPYPSVAQSWQSNIITSNAFAMALSSLLCLFCISHTSLNNWQRLEGIEKKQKQTLQTIIPAKFYTQLLNRNSKSQAHSSQTLQFKEAIIEEHEFCSVVFADFTHFTRYCAEHSQQQIIKTLHNIFCTFDEIASRFELETIKTNGDQYMAVAHSKSSLYANRHTALAACQFALAVRTWFQTQAFKPPMNIRIGIASGESVSGIIGQNKPAYDLWGTTVNTAARLESIARAGGINACSKTVNLTKATLLFSESSASELKGLGKIECAKLLGKR